MATDAYEYKEDRDLTKRSNEVHQIKRVVFVREPTLACNEENCDARFISLVENNTY